jgi:HlyD family secretion protein
MSGSIVDEFLGNRPSAIWRQRLLWLLLAIVLIALVVLVGRFVNGGAPTRYATVTVERDDLQATLTGSGELQEASREVVRASEAGRIAAILVDKGDSVASGQILARLDSAPFKAEVDRAAMLVGTRETALAVAQAKADKARAQLDNFERVRAKSDGLVPSNREMALARRALRDAMDELNDATVEMESAHALIAERQARLALTDIRSPIDGVVVSRPEAGRGVKVSPDEALFEIAAPYSRLRLAIMLQRATAGALHVGSAAQVRIAEQPSRVFPARVAAMRPARSADSSRFIVSLDVQNAGMALRPGMAATVRIGLGVRLNALVVPDAALRFARASDAAEGRNKTDGDAVYVLGEGNTPRRIAVRMQESDGDRRAVVSDDLEPGMLVITGLR